MDPILGQIQLFPYTFAPLNWTLCDGRLLQINQNSALYSLIGVTFGGDGRTTFALPDLRNANPLASTNQMKYYIATAGLYPERP